MLTAFWNSKNIVLVDINEIGATVNSEYCSDIFTTLKKKQKTHTED